MKYWSIPLLILVAICGIGVGALAGVADGTYSAALYLLFFVFSSALFVAVARDIGKADQATRQANEVQEKITQKDHPQSPGHSQAA